MTWAIRKSGWRLQLVEIVKETAKTVSYVDHTWGKRETRGDKGNFYAWRGTEEVGRQLAAKVASARAERERREQAARDWFATREQEIFAQVAQGDHP